MLEILLLSRNHVIDFRIPEFSEIQMADLLHITGYSDPSSRAGKIPREGYNERKGNIIFKNRTLLIKSGPNERKFGHFGYPLRHHWKCHQSISCPPQL